ncbi:MULTISPECIES: Rieske 2Fe-2S domain-containing protein [unclassified Sphingopyxis]|uniref:Rieske 2Fe-2S domain-containing protein n=1 Tax=unclassified Sphingopyxis TaxID=2614943 RepID=UPI0028544652|nr:MULTISPECIES: Rieske 2Fe-2S domain-containing protein [unclassified Sphingopyxis]MDR7060346.1 phenylpropionate dioxygenase-like ring-hydroxylating dioxygenase large terminal subunit [Sphingopyxis sp. BE235]MDR7180141.1 phenylpropionate dioxygenase-like ring-hydroxylating dioxygenase large terminal subunit [Sphingopyxis sp. BE249]
MPKVERFPMPIPYGWFGVGYGAELQVGDVRPVHYFGRDLVLFRNENGEAGLLDAYCPHLGAHMGHGGQVEGDSLRCPFHHWAFRPDGFCSKIPYAKAFPPRAKREPLAKSYPVVEKSGVIWAWYHPDDIAPTFDVIDYPEFTNPEWAEPIKREWRFASNPQEIAENGVDVAHFAYVHAMDAVPEGETDYDGVRRHSVARGHRTIDLPSGERKQLPYSVDTLQNGAGQKFTRLSGLVELSLLVIATPVEADDVELRFCFTHPKVAPGSPEEKAIEAAIENTCGQKGVEGDIPIWHNKIHRARPYLCDGDGPILRFRRYFEQFYADGPDGNRLVEAAE